MIIPGILFKAKLKNFTPKAAKNPTVPVSLQMEFQKNLLEKQPKKNRRNFCGLILIIFLDLYLINPLLFNNGFKSASRPVNSLKA